MSEHVAIRRRVVKHLKESDYVHAELQTKIYGEKQKILINEF